MASFYAQGYAQNPTLFNNGGDGSGQSQNKPQRSVTFNLPEVKPANDQDVTFKALAKAIGQELRESDRKPVGGPLADMKNGF